MIKKSKRAFTLIELIIVIAIIAILAVTAFLVLTKWIGKSRDSRRLNDLSVIEGALQVNYTDTTTYPAPSNVNVQYYSDVSFSGTLLSQGVVGDSVIKTLNLKGSMQDPDSTNMPNTYYNYALNSSGSKSNQYSLMAYMEGTDYNTLTYNFATATTYASRYPKLYGQRIGMLVDGNTKAPIASSINFTSGSTATSAVAIIDTPSSSNATALSGSDLISLIGSAEPGYSLVAYYPFLNGMAGKDRSGKGSSDATVTADIGYAGSGSSIAGVTLGISAISGFTATNSSTVTFWLKGLTGTVTQIASGTNYVISGSTDSIYFATGNGSTRQGLSGTFTSWTNISLVYSSSDQILSLYVNGSRAPTTITTSSGTSNTLRSSVFGGFGGIKIDELRFYNRLMSADEAKMLYTAF